MQFSKFAQNLISKIYADDEESQEYYLNYVSSARKVPVSYLKSIGAFFVPNNDYIYYYGGKEATDINFDIYYSGVCMWTHFLIIPIKTFSGVIVGFVGWDMNNSLKKEQGAVDLPTYRTSGKRVFDKNSYFLMDAEVIHRNFSKSTIFIVDGVFDAISLNYRGIPTISLLGSYPSSIQLYMLHWFKHIYVISDNDVAGYKMYVRIKTAIPRTVRIMQAKTKDIDDFLKSYSKEAEKFLMDIITKPKLYNCEIK